MTVQELLDSITKISVSVDALIAKIQPPADLQPVADALTALKAKVDASVAQ